MWSRYSRRKNFKDLPPLVNEHICSKFLFRYCGSEASPQIQKKVRSWRFFWSLSNKENLSYPVGDQIVR